MCFPGLDPSGHGLSVYLEIHCICPYHISTKGSRSYSVAVAKERKTVGVSIDDFDNVWRDVTD